MTIIVLIINKESPKVMKVIGKASILRTGLMKVLSKPSATATLRESIKSLTCTPSFKRPAVTKMASAETIIFKISFNMIDKGV